MSKFQEVLATFCIIQRNDHIHCSKKPEDVKLKESPGVHLVQDFVKFMKKYDNYTPELLENRSVWYDSLEMFVVSKSKRKHLFDVFKVIDIKCVSKFYFDDWLSLIMGCVIQDAIASMLAGVLYRFVKTVTKTFHLPSQAVDLKESNLKQSKKFDMMKHHLTRNSLKNTKNSNANIQYLLNVNNNVKVSENTFDSDTDNYIRDIYARTESPTQGQGQVLNGAGRHSKDKNEKERVGRRERSTHWHNQEGQIQDINNRGQINQTQNYQNFDTQPRRLSSMASIRALSMDLEELAEAGLYYDEQTDEICCFACSFRRPRNQWTREDNSGHIHATSHPNCRHIRQVGSIVNPDVSILGNNNEPVVARNAEQRGKDFKNSLPKDDHRGLYLKNKNLTSAKFSLPDVLNINEPEISNLFEFYKNIALITIPRNADFSCLQENRRNGVQQSDSLRGAEALSGLHVISVQQHDDDIDHMSEGLEVDIINLNPVPVEINGYTRPLSDPLSSNGRTTIREETRVSDCRRSSKSERENKSERTMHFPEDTATNHNSITSDVRTSAYMLPDMPQAERTLADYCSSESDEEFHELLVLLESDPFKLKTPTEANTPPESPPESLMEISSGSNSSLVHPDIATDRNASQTSDNEFLSTSNHNLPSNNQHDLPANPTVARWNAFSHVASEQGTRRSVTTPVLCVSSSPSGFERRQQQFPKERRRVHETNPWQPATETPLMFLSASAIDEPHVAGSFPPWAARYSSLDLSHVASPEHINLMSRCATFAGWPAASGQEPRIMALAGFYYSGEDRRVCCFYCGLMLDHWSPSDDPWQLHAQYRSSCQYLLKMKGQRFVIDTLICLGKHQRTNE